MAAKQKAPLIENSIEPIPVNQLLLDASNPRLSSGRGSNDQDELVKILWTEMSVDEVALSIAANGFFPEENLFAIPKNPSEKNPEKKKYIVVEGNRRLAAVRLLREPELRAEVKATDLPKLSKAEISALDSLPVSLYSSREQLWEYFGFRHINGPKAWDSFSKAKYVASVHHDYHIPLDEIARKIGDRHSTVQKLYRGYVILQQAEEMASFDRSNRFRNKFYFSHLYTAAEQAEFQKFLGITPKESLKPNPVPKTKLAELSELMTWIYGNAAQEKPPVVRTQNPDLNLLRYVIGNKQALSTLRAGFSLLRSADVAIGDERRFQDALTKSKEDLMDALGTVALGYKGDDDSYRTGKEIVTLTEDLLQAMSKKREGRTKRNA
ncbi:MAG: hypothetical protein HOP17_02145 [Acidobacteria bacterium]|nr:hypothetical protein [Acidobacteriota bacterium]